MGYDGTRYSNDTWNKDLNLKDAFKESCVWYYRKVIDHIGQDQVQKWLDKLEYGNCDISQWKGNGMNSLSSLNGFWLESSLKISPKEQVDILAKIFEGKTDFSKKNITILKEVMLTQQYGNISVYGKTGTGKNVNTGNMDNGWFVGMFENNDERYYFAVHLIDEKRKDVWGPKAKEIALNIIHKYYVEQ
jgi:bla regulator protein BlaR1